MESNHSNSQRETTTIQKMFQRPNWKLSIEKKMFLFATQSIHIHSPPPAPGSRTKVSPYSCVAAWQLLKSGSVGIFAANDYCTRGYVRSNEVILSDLILSYHIISCHIISYHIIAYHSISYHIISYHVSYVICHISYHISYIIYHISYIIYHISYIIYIYHISYITTLYGGSYTECIIDHFLSHFRSCHTTTSRHIISGEGSHRVALEQLYTL